jgi:hypothetical protein
MTSDAEGDTTMITIKYQEIHENAVYLVNYCNALFNESNPRLSPSHRNDLETIQSAARKFQRMVDDNRQILLSNENGILQQIRHDLKNTLNLVIGFTSLLLRESQSPLTPLQYATVQSIFNTGKTLLIAVEKLR